MIHGLTKKQQIATSNMNIESGREVRDKIGFKEQSIYKAVDRDPVAMIESQNHVRIPELIPMRHEKMASSPFSFFRGTALLMAHDLSHQAQTGIHAIICGDAHIGNFGFFASPERRLIFDLNDFDEAAPGPWEWDLKRFLTSIILIGRELEMSENKIREICLEAAKHYRNGLSLMLSMSSLERYFLIGDEVLFLDSFSKSSRADFEKIINKAKTRTSDQVINKMTETDQFGRRIFIEKPPVVERVQSDLMDKVEGCYRAYLKTVRPDIGILLSQHIPTDVARRVVGVGSIGTRCYLLVLTCEDESHLVLQIKQASDSAISSYCQRNFTTPETMSRCLGNGYRVVSHQQMLQAVSDPFLGYFTSEDGFDFYVRQFRDMKGTVKLDELDTDTFKEYARNCGIVLARAHAQSPYANWIKGYLGESDEFDHAFYEWSMAYSQQVLKDFQTYVKKLGLASEK